MTLSLHPADWTQYLFILPTFNHELVDGSWASRGSGLVVLCIDLSYDFTV